MSAGQPADVKRCPRLAAILGKVARVSENSSSSPLPSPLFRQGLHFKDHHSILLSTSKENCIVIRYVHV